MKLWARMNPSGQTSFYIHYMIGGQRKRHLLKGISDPKIAQVAFAEFQVRFAKGQAGLATNEGLSVSDCLKAYVEWRAAVTKESHMRIVRSRVRQIEEHFGTDKPVRLINLVAVNTWRGNLKKEGESSSTINRKAGILRAAIAKAVKDGKLSTNPIEHLERLSDDSRPVWRWLRSNEIQALLDVLKDGTEIIIKPKNREAYTKRLGQNQSLYRLVVFLLNTGARLGEAQAARWADVDLDRGILTLYTTKAARRGAKAKPRHIPLNAAVREILTDMKKEKDIKRAAKEEGAKRTNETIFDFCSRSTLESFQRACDLAGLGHCRIHDLRHTCASHLVMAGTPLNTVRELLGHSSATMTLRYAHLAPEATAKAVETLNFGASKQVAEIVPVGQKAV